MKLVIDTNIYIDFAAGNSAVLNAFLNFGEDLYLPAVVVAELTYGFIKGTKEKLNEKKLQEFIESLDVRIINIDRDTARKYALIYHSLVQKGRKIPINDVWIAASCLSIGGTLITRDKHFDSIEMIDLFSIDS